jgi:proliferating cell nuclear antigen
MQFKTLFDVLKDLLTEVNLRFDEKGFKIVSLDPGKIGMIYLSVFNLEKYVCKDVIYAGLYIGYMYKILRTVSTGHYLEWRIRRDEPKVMEVVLSHHDRRIQTTHHIKILNLDIEEITIPVVEFDCVVSMPSTDLQKHIKELSHVSNVLTIRGNERNIQFIARGDLGDTCIDVSPTPSGLNWIHRKEAGQAFDGSYFIKYIERFSRGQVDNTVELFFRQDYPLIMRYQMTIGSLRFCVAPIQDPKKMSGGSSASAGPPPTTTRAPSKQIRPKAIITRKQPRSPGEEPVSNKIRRSDEEPIVEGA